MLGVIINSESLIVVDYDRIMVIREMLEDYILWLVLCSYCRWFLVVVGIFVFGGIVYLVDFVIGVNVGIMWGIVNVLCGIVIFVLVVFVIGLLLVYYVVWYNIDLDLIICGSGFGYYGLVVINVIFVMFMFIFFVLEGLIMV